MPHHPNISDPQMSLAMHATEASGDRLRAILDRFDVASVRLIVDAARSEPQHVAALVRAVHATGTPVLIDGSVDLARRVGAAGVHVTLAASDDDSVCVAPLVAARTALGADAMVCATPAATMVRHTAMLAGEAGADCLAFAADADAGIAFATDAHLDVETAPGTDVAAAPRFAALSWWSELFEVPCMATGLTHPADVREAVAAGADVVELHITAAMSVSDAVDWADAGRTAIRGGVAT